MPGVFAAAPSAKVAAADHAVRWPLCAEVQELGTKLLQAALALHDKVIGTFRKTAVNFHYE